MAYLVVRNFKENTILSNEEALGIQKIRNAGKEPKYYNIGALQIPSADIRTIVTDNREKDEQGYNLDNPEARDDIKKFEKMLDSYNTGKPTMPLEDYGKYPIGEIVSNPILGNVPWWYVRAAFRMGYIGRVIHNGKKVWCGSHEKAQSGEMGDFLSKLKALKDLRGRRQYAEDEIIPDEIIPSEIPF